MLTLASDLNKDDLRGLAGIHRAAFPTFFLSTLGEPFLRQFYAGFLHDPSAVVVLARETRAVVTKDGPRPEAIGAAVGTTDPVGFYRRLLERRWPGFVAASIRASLRSPAAAHRLLAGITYRGGAGSQTSGDCLLSSICIAPEFQGHGIGGQLLEAWTAKASRAGAKNAYLTTDGVDNEATQGFYSNHGWSPGATYCTRQGRKMQLFGFRLQEERFQT